MYAAEDIGYGNELQGIAPLVAHLRTEQSRAVKEALVSALGRMTHEEVMSQAIGLFESDDAYLRNQAVALLAQRGKAALSHLLRAMASPDPNVRKLALDVVGQIRDPETHGILEAALRDADLNIVITSVEHIGNSQCRELKGRIEDMLEVAKEPMLVTALLETLCTIGDEDSLSLALKCFAPVEQVPEFFQYSLIKLLGELGGVEQGIALCSLLRELEPRLCPQILDAFTRLKERHPETVLPPRLVLALGTHLARDLTDLERFQILRLLRHFTFEPEVALMWRSALRRLKDHELRQSLETVENPER